MNPKAQISTGYASPIFGNKRRSSTVFPINPTSLRTNSVKERIKMAIDREGYLSESLLSKFEIRSILERTEGVNAETTFQTLEEQLLNTKKSDKLSCQELEAFVISLYAPQENEEVHQKVISLLWTPEAKLRHHLRSLISKLEEKGDEELSALAKRSLELVHEFSADSEALYRSRMDEDPLTQSSLAAYEGIQLNEWLSHYSTQLDREKSLNYYLAAKRNRSSSRNSSVSLHSDTGARSFPENYNQELNTDTFLGLVADTSVRDEMKKVLSHDYNLFETCKKIGREKTFCGIGCHLAVQHGFFSDLRIDPEVYYNFLRMVQENYDQTIAYHHDIHAANVVLTCNEFLINGDLINIGKFDELDTYGLMVAAFIHDLGHPGFNNGYLVTSGHEIAITYNDDSVLENFHVAKAFQLMKEENLDVFNTLSTDEYRTIRKIIIDCVLSTDMARHRSHTIALKSKIDMLAEGEAYSIPSTDDNKEKQFLLNTVIHSADIANPCKSEAVYTQWTHLLFDEFFEQGDKEKSEHMPVSFLCDRETVHIANSQIGFLTGICIPLFGMLERLMPGVSYMNDNIEKNRVLMEKSTEEYETHKQEHHKNLKNPLKPLL
mmetsp:Transcript_27030/g.31155  ORF Transcript_27030/g.31155 Transcript_27030/m.31155 type:complete len:605 (+) Transcript_27030:612-2426(+)